mmetsp:Transcript_6690/g.11850  ORF Transcript_6690/g.11850 Transcript_6690/m.11850 type:complete len:257 (-) Transcript_6690:914-1684(-)
MENESLKVRVALHYIKNTPVGELPDVLKDLRKLAGEEVVDDPSIRAAVLQHHIHHCTAVTAGDLKLLVNQYAKKDDYFIDPKLKKAFNVDPYNQTGEILEDVEVEVDDAQAALQEKLDLYLADHYFEVAQGRVYKSDEGYHVVISAHSLNLRNFWTGEWVSQWTLAHNQLSGTVLFRAHYFEDGNLQMNQEKKVSESVRSLDELIPSIITAESAIHNLLGEVYEQLPQSCFKIMRRTMPVTHTRFAETYESKMLSR